MKPQETQRVMAYLAAAYPRAEMSAHTIAVYADGLGDQDFADVMQAARDLVHHSRFMPTVAELREIAREQRRYQQSLEDVGDYTAGKALPTHTAGPDPKADMQRENIRRWRDGEITAAQMAIESARIYAEEGARPADGFDVLSLAREAAAGMGEGEGPMAQRMRNVVQFSKRGSA